MAVVLLSHLRRQVVIENEGREGRRKMKCKRDIAELHANVATKSNNAASERRRSFTELRDKDNRVS